MTAHQYEIDRLQKLCKFLELAHTARDAKIQHLHAHGVKVRTLVEASGLSRQRVHQIINGPAAGLPGAATVAKARARADMDKAERLMNQARMRESSERRTQTQALTPADVDRLIATLRAQ
jgi:hypothetical protein